MFCSVFICADVFAKNSDVTDYFNMSLAELMAIEVSIATDSKQLTYKALQLSL